MNMMSGVFWGFAGTILLTTLLSGSRALGLTRMDIPYLVGAIFTPNRDKAKVIGFLVHVTNGWLFGFVYIMAFKLAGMQNWWFGALIGLVHAAFLLLVGMNILPSLHPRMANEFSGPDPTRQLEPPGFLALNYGRGTPIATFLAHIIYGAVLGLFYK